MQTILVSPYAIPGLKAAPTHLSPYPENETDIMHRVTKHFGVNEAQLRQKCRKREIVLPRSVCMVFFKMYTRWPYKKIGEYFCGFDHTTVIHAIQSIRNDVESDTAFKEELESIFPLNWEKIPLYAYGKYKVA